MELQELVERIERWKQRNAPVETATEEAEVAESISDTDFQEISESEEVVEAEVDAASEMEAEEEVEAEVEAEEEVEAEVEAEEEVEAEVEAEEEGEAVEESMATTEISDMDIDEVEKEE